MARSLKKGPYVDFKLENKINKLNDDFWTISTLSKYSGINRIIHNSFSFETLKKSKTPTIILPN